MSEPAAVLEAPTRTACAEMPPKFDGERIKLGDREYVLPSLSIKQAKHYWPQICEIDGDIDEPPAARAARLPEKWDVMVPIIHAALTRNYPALDLDEAFELIELKNVIPLFAVVCAASGLKARPGIVPASAKTPQ